MSEAPGDTVRNVLDKAENLGLFPAAAIRIRAVSADPNASLSKMEEAVSMDPALGARILKLANSPFYGLPRGVGSLRQAIFVLGFRAIQGLALSLSLMSVGRTASGHRRLLWEHALRTGTTCRVLAAHLPQVDAHEAFIAGMLHDLGEMLLLEVEGQGYRRILDMYPDGHTGRAAAERARLGCTHGEVGAACLEDWLLPEALCQAVLLHHDPVALIALEGGDVPTLAEIVWVADTVARHLEADPEGTEVERVAHLADAPVTRKIGLDAVTVGRILDDTRHALERLTTD